MYGDLRAAHLVRAFDATSAENLVTDYERGQVEAVLLRATRVRVELVSPSAGAARRFFRRLKFLGLLFTIERAKKGYHVAIDGPMSLFEASTGYGLKFALLSRQLAGCGAWTLEADVLWGREREPLSFRARGEAPSHEDDEPPLSDDASELLAGWRRLDTPWQAKATSKVLHVPGVGIAVPDLVFTRDGRSVYCEILGYWSRASVWRRVELVEAGLHANVLFAVNHKLRVSEEVLSDETPSSLYVYKRAMSPRAIAEKLEALAARPMRDEATDIEEPGEKPRKRRGRARKETGAGPADSERLQSDEHDLPKSCP